MLAEKRKKVQHKANGTKVRTQNKKPNEALHRPTGVTVLTVKQKKQMEAPAPMPDETIDTSDSPELTAGAGLRRVDR